MAIKIRVASCKIEFSTRSGNPDVVKNYFLFSSVPNLSRPMLIYNAVMFAAHSGRSLQ